MDVVINCQSPDIRNIAARLKRNGILCIDHQHIVERTPSAQPVGHPFQGLAYEHAFAYFMTCSNQLKRWFRNHGVAEEKLIAVPNGPGILVTDDDLATARKRVNERDPQAESDRKLRAIFLGRLERQKGVDRLAELISDTVGYVDWRVIGKAVVGADESAAIQAHGIEIEPPVYRSDDIRAALEWADVMVLPSRFEGLPLVIIDAMSSGVPVIATNVGAVSEAIEHGKTGFIFEETNYLDEARRVLENLSSSREQVHSLAKSALDSAQNLSWQSQAEPFLLTLDKAISQIKGSK
jgi:glycosyltransferase involved in cell wall biosynthesis